MCNIYAIKQKHVTSKLNVNRSDQGSNEICSTRVVTQGPKQADRHVETVAQNV